MTIRQHQNWGFEFDFPFENVFLEVENYLQSQEVAIENNTSQFELWVGLKIQMLVEQFFKNLIKEVTQKRDRCFWYKNLVSVFLQEKKAFILQLMVSPLWHFLKKHTIMVKIPQLKKYYINVKNIHSRSFSFYLCISFICNRCKAFMNIFLYVVGDR